MFLDSQAVRSHLNSGDKRYQRRFRQESCEGSQGVSQTKPNVFFSVIKVNYTKSYISGNFI